MINLVIPFASWFMARIGGLPGICYTLRQQVILDFIQCIV